MELWLRLLLDGVLCLLLHLRISAHLLEDLPELIRHLWLLKLLVLVVGGTKLVKVGLLLNLLLFLGGTILCYRTKFWIAILRQAFNMRLGPELLLAQEVLQKRILIGDRIHYGVGICVRLLNIIPTLVLIHLLHSNHVLQQVLNLVGPFAVHWKLRGDISHLLVLLIRLGLGRISLSY